MTVPSRVISTWFYENALDEGGQYAQVRGDSSSEEFRDIYRRYIGVFFASARRANPAARLLLYLNTPWNGTRSSDAEEVNQLLALLDVEQVVVPYHHMPPDSWSKAWWNQFFVLDVLEDLVQRCDPVEVAVVLDSDIVWNSRGSAETMWRRMVVDELLTYDVGYSPDHVVNGLSRRMLTQLGVEIEIPGLSQDYPVSYMGGEFIGGTISRLEALVGICGEYWARLMERHANDSTLVFEEAHLLSLAYAGLGAHTGNANPFVRRLWTQPLKPRNVHVTDRDLALWHVPAEKKYGLRRVFRQYVTHGHLTSFLSMSPERFQRVIPGMLGIPRNSVGKGVADVTAAAWGRIRETVKE